MAKRLGIICIVLGVLCLLAAAGIVLYNRWEAQQAAQSSKALLEDVRLAMAENKISCPDGGDERLETKDDHAPVPAQMATVDIDGDKCIGILSVPALGLELPVLTDWSYAKLKKAPCHYYGSCYEKNFVIAAHNFDAHFGRLSELQAGDIVIFTDVQGTGHSYEVVLLETLPPTATQTMIASGFDLSLYTCTPGGGNRVTVRCSAKNISK